MRILPFDFRQRPADLDRLGRVYSAASAWCARSAGLRAGNSSQSRAGAVYGMACSASQKTLQKDCTRRVLVRQRISAKTAACGRSRARRIRRRARRDDELLPSPADLRWDAKWSENGFHSLDSVRGFHGESHTRAGDPLAAGIRHDSRKNRPVPRAAGQRCVRRDSQPGSGAVRPPRLRAGASAPTDAP